MFENIHLRHHEIPGRRAANLRFWRRRRQLVSLVVVVLGLLGLPSSGTVLGQDTPASLAFDRPVTALAYSQDGRNLASGDEAGEIKVWFVRRLTLVITLSASKGVVHTLAFRPDDKVLAASSRGDSVWLWDTTSWRERATSSGKQHYMGMAFSPGSKTLAVGDSDGTLTLLDGNNCKILEFFKGHTGFINSLAFSSDGALLASGGRGPDLKLWDLTKLRDRDARKLLADLEGHEDHVTAVAFSPDSKTLFSASLDGTVKLWDVATRKEKATLKVPEGGKLTCMVLSPDGKTVAAGGNFKDIALWDVATLKPLKPLSGHTDNVLALAFKPDGKTLASSSKDRTVRFWDLPQP
jgi:WD40 repeat protein